MQVSIVGAGYVGLVTGACLADLGHEVVCVDSDGGKVESINCAVSPIHERGLGELLERNVGRRLAATTDLERAVTGSDLTLIAVGTPFDGQAIDLTAVQEAAGQVGRALRRKTGYHLVVVKSTVVPGTTDSVVLPIVELASGKKAGADFGIGMNPEFLSEGEAVEEFMSPDRIVIGGIDRRSIELQEQLYGVLNGAPVIRTNTRTAEMIKYASNALLATMISFANEIGNLCASLGGIDAMDVMRGVHLSRYLATASPGGGRSPAPIVSFLQAGCGFGGSCLPKDVSALIAHGNRAGAPMPLLEAVMSVNRQQPVQIRRLLERHFPTLDGVRVAVLGLAFKPGTDDVRESPAIPIIRELRARGASVRAYDPVATDAARRVLDSGGLVFSTDLARTVADAQAVVVVTRWEEFSNLPELLMRLDSAPLVVDGRRMLDRHSVPRYEGIGC